MKSKLVFLACLAMLSARTMAQSSLEPEVPLKYFSVPIVWVKNIQGDFSFAKKWEYATGITRNKHGQLVRWHSPGAEPEGMFEPNGRIKKDSLQAYYKMADTAHYYYNVHWESNCYPRLTETDDIMEVVVTPGNVYCSNSLTAKSNCKFKMSIGRDTCYFLSAVVDVVDVTMYDGVSGDMEIDRLAWQEGILKAKFSFLMRNPINTEETHFWRGIMYIDMKGENHSPDFVPGNK